MGKTLDIVVSQYVHNNAEEKQEQPLILAAEEENIKKKIIEEIEPGIREEEYKKAKAKVEAEENEKKLEELKEIIWSGFLLAFLVGLLVNQVTDVITRLKNGSMIWTGIMIIVLGGICFAVFCWMFVARVKKIYDDIKKNKFIN